MSAAEEHRRIAADFAATVDAVAPDAWEQPAPPEGWTARDVVRHLLEWFPGFLQERTGITLAEAGSVDADPGAAWRSRTTAVQALLDDATTAGQEYELPMMGTMRLDQIVDRLYTTDVFLHRWDLARATGQDDTLDPVKCAEILEGMEPMDAALRQSGHFGPKVDVPADADVQTRLLAFVGRRR